jgi:hypothetical protein
MTLTELATRSSGGLTVVLGFDPETRQAFVDVDDRVGDERFQLEVQEGDNPLDVYNHPFAYRALVER